MNDPGLCRVEKTVDIAPDRIPKEKAISIRISKALLLFYCCLFLSPFILRAQLVVQAVGAQQLVTGFFGPSVQSISNLQFSGGPDFRGVFNATATNLGLDSGLILATGDISLAKGPNDLLEVGIFDGNGLPGDPALTAIAGYPTQDASVLEFDFIPASDTLDISYVFASEEYPEWVSSGAYNDVFALLLDGVNIALLPDATSVCVNHVNCFNANPASYRCNDPVSSASPVHCNASFNCPDSVDQTTLQYDGLTVPLLARILLTPGTPHHLKIGIADVSDNGADCGVFLSLRYSHPWTNSITGPDAHNGLEVFPNPCKGSLQYRCGGDRLMGIRVTDLLGRDIWHIATSQANGTIQLPSYILPGVYYLVADTPLRRYNTRVVVVQ